MPLRSIVALLIFDLLFANALCGDIHGVVMHGRRAVVIENDLMRVAAFSGGGYLGEIRLKSKDPLLAINPMRVPHYKTIEPQDYDDEKHNALYGEGGDRKIMAGYMGHFLCFPYLGGLSQQEKDQGLGAHGEAAVVEWKVEEDKARKARGDGVVLQMEAELPLTKYHVKRSL